MPGNKLCVTACRDPRRGKDPACPGEQSSALPQHPGKEAGNEVSESMTPELPSAQHSSQGRGDETTPRLNQLYEDSGILSTMGTPFFPMN